MIVTHSTRNLSRSYKIFIIIFATLTILQCNSVYDSNVFGELLINGIWQMFLFILCIYSLHKIFNRRIDNDLTYLNKLVIFLFCYVCVIIPLLIFYYIYSPFTLFYVILFLIDPIMIMICFVGSINNNTKKISKYFFYILEDIVLFLAVISLIFWALYQSGLSPNMTTTIKWGGLHQIQGLDYLQFLPQNGKISFLGGSVLRNTGIFVEAPMYSYVLSVALLIELFIRTSTSKFKVLLLTITIFSTTSTTGVVVAILAISYYIFISMNSSLKYLIILLTPIVLILLKFVLLNKMNATGSSYGIRSSEWHIDVLDWKQHLIIGNGLPSIGSGGSNQSLFGAVGLSSGLMASLAYGGIILEMFYLLPSLCSLIVSKKIFGLSVLSFLLFILTIVINSYLYIIILSYLWISFILRNCINRNVIGTD